MGVGRTWRRISSTLRSPADRLFFDVRLNARPNTTPFEELAVDSGDKFVVLIAFDLALVDLMKSVLLTHARGVKLKPPWDEGANTQ